jgi:hypothetical protein
VKVSSLLKFHSCTFSQIKGNSSNNSIHDLLNESNLEAKFPGVLMEYKYVVMNIGQKRGDNRKVI